MSSHEYGAIARQVEDLAEQVRGLSMKVDGVATLEPRVEALESTTRAHSARLEHISKVMLDIQREIQKLDKSVAASNFEQNAKLDGIAQLQYRILDLLQPKAVL